MSASCLRSPAFSQRYGPVDANRASIAERASIFVSIKPVGKANRAGPAIGEFEVRLGIAIADALCDGVRQQVDGAATIPIIYPASAWSALASLPDVPLDHGPAFDELPLATM